MHQRQVSGADDHPMFAEERAGNAGPLEVTVAAPGQ